MQMSRRNHEVEDPTDDSAESHQDDEAAPGDEVQIPTGPNPSALRNLLESSRTRRSARPSQVPQDKHADTDQGETEKSLR